MSSCTGVRDRDVKPRLRRDSGDLFFLLHIHYVYAALLHGHDKIAVIKREVTTATGSGVDQTLGDS